MNFPTLAIIATSLLMNLPTGSETAFAQEKSPEIWWGITASQGTNVQECFSKSTEYLKTKGFAVQVAPGGADDARHVTARGKELSVFIECAVDRAPGFIARMLIVVSTHDIKSAQALADEVFKAAAR